MAFFRKRKPIPAVPAPQKRGGSIFSTDEDLSGIFTDAADLLKQAIAKSIQRPMGHGMTVVDEQGNAVAMDDGDLQCVKAQNTAYGSSFLPPTQFAWYANQAFIGYQACAIIFQNWLVNKACRMAAEDAVRHGYEITVNDGSDLDPKIAVFMRQRDKAFKVKKNCVEHLTMGRCFGIRVAMFEIDIPSAAKDAFYANPFNIDAVRPGSYKGISQIDPYWITPELDMQAAANPASMHFYEPTWWRINGKRVHRSHLVIMKNGTDMPDILKPTYFYGGIPVAQKIAERVYAAERTANEAPMLAMTKRLTVLKTDITQAAANPVDFESKMGFWSSLMSNFGIKVVGEGEEIEQYDTSLTDVDVVIMTQYQLVAAAADVPATKLMGTSPKGFGASGEYEESSYHEFLESQQEHHCSPLVDRHHALLMKSEVMPKFGCKFIETEVAWRSADSPTAKETAEINLIKAQTGNQLVQAGAIDGCDERNRIVTDPDSGYNGIEAIVPDGPGDREAMQEAEAALEQPAQASNKAKSGDGGK